MKFERFMAEKACRRISGRRLVVEFIFGEISRKQPILIVIAGPGCTGKSTFAVELANAVEQRGLGASVLDLDCYLIERAVRLASPTFIGGYNPAGYRLDQAATDLAKLQQGEAIFVSPYNKLTSGRKSTIRISPAPVLIVEGSMALYPSFPRRGDLNIYFTASDDVLFENRKRRESGYGLSEQQIRAKFLQLSDDLPLYISPQRAHSDICIEVDRNYDFVAFWDNAKPS